jgi:hypothetical protein
MIYLRAVIITQKESICLDIDTPCAKGGTAIAAVLTVITPLRAAADSAAVKGPEVGARMVLASVAAAVGAGCSTAGNCAWCCSN